VARWMTVLWAYVISWVCSALLHAVDADVGSIQGLWKPEVLLSVFVDSFLILTLVFVCRAGYIRNHWKGFFLVVSGLAMSLGFVVAIVGFGGGSVQSRLIAFLGMSALFGIVLVGASVPTIWMENTWSKRARTRPDLR